MRSLALFCLFAAPLDAQEKMDADAFEAFTQTGDAFNPELAQKLKTHIYAAGGSKPAEELYRAFRGSMPDITPLLRGRGLI